LYYRSHEIVVSLRSERDPLVYFVSGPDISWHGEAMWLWMALLSAAAGSMLGGVVIAWIGARMMCACCRGGAGAPPLASENRRGWYGIRKRSEEPVRREIREVGRGGFT